jgi:GNAT superfamily N-acetyltransferase
VSAPQARPRVVLTAEPLDGPVAGPLVAEMVLELQVRYDDEGAAGKALVAADFAAPTGTFLVAHLDGTPVGCGGLRTVAPGVGEVKRMYVDPAARGRGVARALLAGLEQAAAGLGLTDLLLETGTAQPEAIALYVSSGWRAVPPYGEWAWSPESRCFGKTVR